MSLAKGLCCSRCQRPYPLDTMAERCQSCNGALLVDYDYEGLGKGVNFQIKDLPGIWKYLRLLPVRRQNNIVSLGEGGTFLHKCDRLGRELGIKRVYIKDESTNPTGAFLDRGVTVEVSRALELGFRHIRCRASGNIGAALAAYAAKAGLDCTLYLSGRIDVGKLYQMIAYGANMEFVEGNDEASDSDERSGDILWLKTNSPYFLDGLKTTGYEICEQLGWALPDRIIVPMGSGAHISMIWRSLNELHQIGLVKNVKTMMCGIQASGCAPIVKAFVERKSDAEALERVETSIVDIAVRSPAEGFLALKSFYDSKGIAAAVSDKEILEAARVLAREEGIFAEPAGASTVAGLKKLASEGRIGKDEEVVCVITGMGLKDPKSARSFIERSRGMERFVRAMEAGGFTTKLGGTKLKILRALSGNEQYGYLIWRDLRRKYHMEISIPSIYQHLLELERSGLIQRTRTQRISGRPERHYYSVTAKGKSTMVQAERLERTGKKFRG